jgi:cold shock CspA family protein
MMKVADGVPPRLPLAQLEGLAAGPPVPSAAWWITHQSCEHLFEEAAGIDPRTGGPVAQPLGALLAGLRKAGVGAVRPFPADRVWRAAAFASEPLARLIQQHRHRIVRSHAELPMHRVREIDARSVSWLVAQPGRTVREKLASRQHMLAVQREQSADTMENRMLVMFARQLALRAEIRLGQAAAYDSGAADQARRERLESVLDLCRRRLPRSDLGDLPMSERIRPNNVLLGDPAYSRVYRAWQWLRDEEAALDACWPAALERARVALFWLVAARLCALPGVSLADTFARVRDGVVPSIELLGMEGGEPRWLANPELHLLASSARPGKPRQFLRLALRGDGLLVRFAKLEGEGALRTPQGSGVRFSLRPSGGEASRGRGVPVQAEGGDIRIDTFADLGGLSELAGRVTAGVARLCGLDLREPAARAPTGASTDGAAALAFGSASIVASSGNAVRLSSMPWAASYALPEQGQAAWLEGLAGRMAGLCQPAVYGVDEVVEGLPGADHAALAMTARLVAGAAARELALPASMRLAWTMPDGGTAAAQRTLRGAMQGVAAHGVPVWRSVAAAMAWLGEHPAQVRTGDEVLVIDTEFSSATLTPLVARHDDTLEQRMPESAGLYWERRPPIPDTEETTQLGWPNVLHAYARKLVARAAGAVLPESQCEALAASLVHTGTIGAMLADGGEQTVLARTVGGADFDALAIAHDPALFEELAQAWMERLQQAAGDFTRRERGRPPGRRVLVAGGPFDGRGTHLGTVLTAHPDKGFGFVRLADSDERLFLHVSELAAAALPAGGARLAFDIANGSKGRAAANARVISDAEYWCRANLIPVSLEQIASGARMVSLRQGARCVSWREWLPDLLLEVARGGHVVQVPLCEKILVDPVPGSSREFFAPLRFALPADRSTCVLPVSEAGDSPRSGGWELRLQSALLPLAQDLPVSIGVRHVYGADTSYRLVVRPQAAASFAVLEAQPVPHGGRQAPLLEPGGFALPGSDKRLAERFTREVGDFISKGLPTLDELLKRNRPEERSWAAHDGVAAAGRRLAAHLAAHGGSGLADEIDRMLVRIALDGAQEQDGERIAALDAAAGDSDAVPQLLRVMGLAVGSGDGWRAGVLDSLLRHVARHGSYESFNPGYRAAAVRALAKAVWREPGLVASLSSRPGVAAWLASDCMRSLGSMLPRVPYEADGEVLERVKLRYVAPFVNACELLLALCMGALREGPLSTSSETAVALARLTRQLDARMHALGLKRHWWVMPAAPAPSGLQHMSPLVYALGAQLAPGTAESLLRLSE